MIKNMSGIDVGFKNKQPNIDINSKKNKELFKRNKKTLAKQNQLIKEIEDCNNQLFEENKKYTEQQKKQEKTLDKKAKEYFEKNINDILQQEDRKNETENDDKAKNKNSIPKYKITNKSTKQTK